MPRKDLTQERTDQILDAFERCVVERGLGATSLEHVASEAGVQRSLLRHYVGNRDDLVLAMATRLLEAYRAQLLELEAYAREGPPVERLLACLFPAPPTSEFSKVVVAEALIAESARDEELRALMTALVRETVVLVRDLLLLEYPDADRKAVAAVAYGVVGISFNHDSLAALALPPRFRRDAAASAERLIRTLEP